MPYLQAKWAFDLVAALVALAILAPLFLVIAALIRLESPGPALFRQMRTGRGGRAFCILKFRTMRGGDGGLAHDDRQVTRLGRMLRMYRLDELPQLLNIVRGDMSWIGPRPQPVHYAEAYAARIEGYGDRLAVRPGITGWAQVNQGHVNGVEDEAVKLSFDRQYITRLSLGLDALIVLRTIPVILRGGGR